MYLNVLDNQSIKNHPLYPEYAKMRIRERILLQEQDEIREECAEIEDFKEACQRMKRLGPLRRIEPQKRVRHSGLHGLDRFLGERPTYGFC